MDIRILFVDDEPEFVRPHILALEEAGYRVSHVMTYSDALRELQRQKFDLVILDLIIPPGDAPGDLQVCTPRREVGLRLHRAIREDPRSKSYPILFLTVINSVDVRSQILDTEQAMGVPSDRSDFQQKPTWPTVVCSKVKRLLGG